MTKNEIVDKNSEILFLYDAKMCNPNGDMDDENKPRMDKETETNLVSDVRLKRYVRDYLHIFKDKLLWVDDDAADGKSKLKWLEKQGIDEKDLIDLRLFGAVLPKTKGKGDEERGITGPVQFTWGYSLNKAEILESKTITSKWKGGEGIGKDFRIKYSFLAFSGFINSKIAQCNEDKGMNEEDLFLFEEALLRSMPLLSTRSKYGQYPRFYVRVELKDDSKSLKDLREYISLNTTEGLSDIMDVELDISPLVSYLKDGKDLINKIFWWSDDKIRIKGDLKDTGISSEKIKLWDSS